MRFGHERVTANENKTLRVLLIVPPGFYSSRKRERESKCVTSHT